LSSLPVEYLEIGYRSIEKETYMGKYFYNPINTIKRIKDYSPKVKLALMLNAKDCLNIDLSKLLGDCKDYIELIRIAIDPDKIESGLPIAGEVKKMGCKVALNLMYLSKLDINQRFYNYLDKLSELLDYLYLVDSYGGLYPEELKKMINIIKTKTNIKLGFHGHNNIELAFINSLVAIENGVDMIDCTILGMGRGACNLKTELILSYMNSKLNVKMDFTQFSELISSFEKLLEKCKWGTNFAYMTSGFNSLPQKDIMEWLGKRRYSISSIIQILNNKKAEDLEDNKIKTINGFIDRLNIKKYRKSIIVPGGESA